MLDRCTIHTWQYGSFNVRSMALEWFAIVHHAFDALVVVGGAGGRGD